MSELEHFVEQQLHLLQLEFDAELNERRQYIENRELVQIIRNGFCINKLRISSIKTGLFQRTLVKFCNSTIGKEFCSHQLTSGDIVGLYKGKKSDHCGSGIVISINTSEITIAFDKDYSYNLDEAFNNYCIIKLTNDVTYKRLKKALNDLRKVQNCRLASLLLGDNKFSSPTKISSIHFFNKDLDESQKDAVKFALEQKEVAIIHGPPGTGKTTTLVEIILQLTEKDKKVLVCAPSNIAVDNLIEKLVPFKKNTLVRLGHPARANSELQKYTLDALLYRSDQILIIEDIRKEIDQYRTIKKGRIGDLRKELKKREKSAVESILAKCKIVLSTLTSASIKGPIKYIFPQDGDHRFDVVIIDECSQALESACWIVLPYANKCIIAGDHLQLPPTIVSKEAAKAGLKISLMERLLKRANPNDIVKMLTVQYRMNDLIMQWASQNFYENKLVAHASIRDQCLKDISDSQQPVLVLIDTSDFDLEELDLEDGESKGNDYEADLVANYVERLIYDNIKVDEIGVITPYNCQVDLIRLRLAQNWPNLEIKTIDGFQGREKEAIILSLVRSNKNYEVGFLSDWKRINVAVTRAKRHLAVICDSKTVSTDPYLASLIEYIFENGEVEIPCEYLNDTCKFSNIPRPNHLIFRETKKQFST